MKEFTPDEIKSITKAMSQEPPGKDETQQLPLRTSNESFSRVSFGPIIAGETPPKRHHLLTEKELSKWKDLKVTVEVVFGNTTLTLEELTALEPGNLVSLDQLANEPVDIYINGIKMGKGEIVSSQGHYAVKVLFFEEKKKKMV